MPIMSWKDDLSVNVAEIDTQHKKLIGLINDLFDAMSQKKSREILGSIINGLTDYTVTHFSFEETQFDKFKYAGTFSHKKEHKDFVDKVNGFRNKFNAGNLSLSIEIMQFLKDWLLNHITVIDKKYSRFFNDNGLK